MDRILINGGVVTVVPNHVTVMTVHAADDCAGRTCVVHTPTEHHMRSWPLHWRADRGIFERTCLHGIGHPDIDQQAYWREQAERGEVADERLTADGPALIVRDPDAHVTAMMTHGCDGCCRASASVE